jgi:hypothetical protein
VTPLRQSIALGLIVATAMTIPVVLRAQHGQAAHPASQPSSRPESDTAKAPAAVAPASQPSDVKSIVDRIQKRIAEEVPSRSGQKPADRVNPSRRQGASTSAAGGGAARTARTARTTDPVSPRVQLEWRLSLVWPAELTQVP